MQAPVVFLLLGILAPHGLQAELYWMAGDSGPTIPSRWQPQKNSRALVRAFDRLDSDNNESLSPAELLEVTTKLDGSFEDTAAIIHAWFDGDESGGIDLGEWQDGRGGDGNPEPPDLTGDAGPELDANGNGKVSRREFWRVIPCFVPGTVTRSWYPAQFPGGQVTGASRETMNWWDFPITAVGPDTPLAGVAIGGSGTLTLGSGASAWSSGVSAQWSSGSVALSSIWLQSLPERDAMLPFAEGTLSFEIARLRSLENPSIRSILPGNWIVDLSNFPNFVGTDPAIIQFGAP